ncbi:hypothetical protein NDU88_006657 [Pleurodeles waltl]|uniref:Uncharacterized protein n=1 Tax=Pleurodeles waltl TaxID=8319 RepID=A0AAV7PRB0_PLEWA|nr:hypothetical protein NDU88_006657 [Pleurodeles waltl]
MGCATDTQQAEDNKQVNQGNKWRGKKSKVILKYNSEGKLVTPGQIVKAAYYDAKVGAKGAPLQDWVISKGDVKALIPRLSSAGAVDQPVLRASTQTQTQHCADILSTPEGVSSPGNCFEPLDGTSSSCSPPVANVDSAVTLNDGAPEPQFMTILNLVQA